MIHSSIVKDNDELGKEDPKTSTVFENLILFPDETIWDVIYESITYKENLQDNVGTLNEYFFWPKWDSTGTGNLNYVEPDVFLRFEKLDVIIEAKRSDESGQDDKEWSREIRAYNNEYLKDKKPYILLSVGGNENMTPEEITIIGYKKVIVYKCSWLSILITIDRLRKNPDKKIERQQLRLIDNLILGFESHGVLLFHWMNTIPFDRYKISPQSFNTINNFHKY